MTQRQRWRAAAERDRDGDRDSEQPALTTDVGVVVEEAALRIDHQPLIKLAPRVPIDLSIFIALSAKGNTHRNNMENRKL